MTPPHRVSISAPTYQIDSDSHWSRTRTNTMTTIERQNVQNSISLARQNANTIDVMLLRRRERRKRNHTQSVCVRKLHPTAGVHTVCINPFVGSCVGTGPSCVYGLWSSRCTSSHNCFRMSYGVVIGAEFPFQWRSNVTTYKIERRNKRRNENTRWVQWH